MIPQFPNFKLLEITDKDEYEQFVKQFPPSSDFNFVGVWSSNNRNDDEISFLNGNLVGKFCDYITLEPFYTFIGDNKVEETIETLFRFLKEKNLKPELRRIPESNLHKDWENLNNKFLIEESRDDFDYIISLNNLVELKGDDYKNFRNGLSKFEREVPTFVLKLLDLNDLTVKNEIVELCFIWGTEKNKTTDEIEDEVYRIEMLMEGAKYLDLSCLGVYVEGRLKAFYLAEKIQDKYAMGHYRKADPSIPGIFQFIDHENAKHLLRLGCELINYEQDLGFPNLRASKEALKPVSYLKKYTIKVKV